MAAPLTESSAANVSREPMAGGIYGSLQLVSDAGEVKHTYAIRKPRIVFGRDPDSDVRLLLKEVSRRHCELVFEQPRSAILQVNGANGVLYNGVHVQPKARIMLSEGDRVQIAKHRLQFSYGGDKVSAAAPVCASREKQAGENTPVKSHRDGLSLSPAVPRKEAEPAECSVQPEQPAAAPIQAASYTQPEEPADKEVPADGEVSEGKPPAPAQDEFVQADKTPVVQPVSPLPRPSPTALMPASEVDQASPEDAKEDAEDEESIMTLCLGDSEAAVQREAATNAAPPATSPTSPSKLEPAAASPLGMPRTPPMFSPKTRRLSLRTATLLKSGSKFPLVPMSESRNRHRAMHWSPSPTADRGNARTGLPTAPERQAINIDDASDEDDDDDDDDDDDELEVDKSLDMPSPTLEAQDRKSEMPTPLIRKLPSIGFLTPQGKRTQTQQRRLSDYTSGSQMPEPQLKHRSSWSWLSGFFANLSPQRSPKAPADQKMDVDGDKAEQAGEDVDMAGEQSPAATNETPSDSAAEVPSSSAAEAPTEASVEHTEDAMEPADPEPAALAEAAEVEAPKPTEPAEEEPIESDTAQEMASAQPAEHTNVALKEEDLSEASETGALEISESVAPEPVAEAPLAVSAEADKADIPEPVMTETPANTTTEQDAGTSLAEHDAAAPEPESYEAREPATPAKELPTSDTAPAAPTPEAPAPAAPASEAPTPDLRSLKHLFAEPKHVSGQEEVMADFRHVLRQHDAAQADAADTSVGGALQSMMATPAKPASQPAAQRVSATKPTTDENAAPSAPSAGTAISAGVRRSTRTLRSPTADAQPARGAGMRAGVRRTEPFVPTRRQMPPRAAAPLRTDLAPSARPKAEPAAEAVSQSTAASSGTRRTAMRSELPRRTTRSSAARRP